MNDIIDRLRQFGSEGFPIALESAEEISRLRARLDQADAEMLEELATRDRYHDIADSLAHAIAEHFGADIGDHSNLNCPWYEALDVIENAHVPAIPEGWQLIETAPPPEGDPFLAFHPDWIDEDFSPKGIRECHRYGDGTEYNSARWFDYRDCWVEDDQTPTHWMPLPAGPKS